MKNRFIKSLLLGCILATLFAASTGCDAVDRNAVEPHLALYAEGTYWPSGIVPVCWTASSRARSDFATRSLQVRDILNTSWPAVAKVSFTGWGACPSDTSGIVAITLNDSFDADASVGYRTGPNWVNLGVSRSDFTGGLIPHEFGHVLGFGHEMRRPDFVDDASGACRESNGTSTNYLGTQADRESIMASTGYCQSNPTLDLWDIFGAQQAYGKRTTAVAVMVTAYSSSRMEHATVATDAGLSSVQLSGYQNAYADGFVFTSQMPSTVPLKLYWSASRTDNFLVGTADSEQAALANGYTLARTEGYAYSTSQPGTVPLNSYWSAARNENLTTASLTGQAAALAAGYTLNRTEGYIFQNRPYDVLWFYWNAARGDNLSAGENSTFAQNAEASSYSYVGFDNLALRYSLPGTSSLDTYWNATREDHMETATTAGRQSATSSGYTLLQTEGYVFTASQSGTIALQQYWLGSPRDDNFATSGYTSTAVSSGYTLVRTEGYVLATQ